MTAPETDVHRRGLKAAGIGMALVDAAGRVAAMDERAFRLLGLDQRFPSVSLVVGCNGAELGLHTPPKMEKDPCIQDIPWAGKTGCVRAEWLAAEEGGFTVLLREAARPKADDPVSPRFAPLVAFLKGLPGMVSISERVSGRYVAVNDEWVAQTGYASGDCIGKTSLEMGIISADTFQEVRRWAVETGASGEIELDYVNAWGEQRRVVYMCRPIVFEGRDCLVSSSIDVTRFHEAREKLRASEQLFSRAFAASPTMMAFTRMSDGVAMAVNRSWCENTGWREEEVIGRTYRDLNVIAPDVRERVLDAFQNRGEMGPFDVPYRTRGGEERKAMFGLERIEVSGVECLLTVANDITDRVRAEEALRASELRFSKVFHASPAMMSIYQRPGFEVVDVNAAWCTHAGYAREEVLGRSTAELDMITPEKRAELAAHFESGEVVEPVELEYKPKTGPMRTSLLSLVPIELAGAPCYLMTAVDITELLQRRRELRETELRLQEMASNIRDVFWITNHDLSQLLYINEAYETLFGRGREELFADQGLSVRDIHEADRDRVWEVMQAAPFDEQVEIEFRIAPPERAAAWVQCRIAPIRDAEGKVVRLAGVLTEITQRKAAEEALAEREVRYRTLFTSSSDAILVESDNGEVLDANPAACELFGYGQQEWNGLDARCLLPPESRGLVEELVACDPPSEEVNMELEAQKKSGERFIADMRSVRAATVRGVLVFVILRDVTPRRRAEARLRESERRYRLITESIASFAYAYKLNDEGGLEVLWLEGAVEQVTGRPQQEAMWPADWNRLVLPADMGDAARHRERLQRGEPHEAEFRIAQPGGAVRWIRDYGRPVMQEDGLVDIVVGAVQDVTERREAQAALEESEAKYRRLFEMESDALFLIDNETGAILDANAAAARLYGYEREELLAKRNTDLSAEPAATRQATAEETPRIAMRHHRRRDGTVFPVEITSSFFRFKERHVHIAAIREISDRIRREEELREAHELFAGFMDRFPGGAFIKTLDGRHVFLNRYVCEVLGAKDWQGHSDREVFPPAVARRLSIEDQRAFSSGMLTVVEELACADGQTRSYRTLKFPIYRQGKPPILGGIALDISEQMRAENLLRQSESRYRRLVRTLPHGLVELDRDGCIQLANETFADIAGKTEAVLHGATLQHALDADGMLPETVFAPSEEPARVRISGGDAPNPRWLRLDWQPQLDDRGNLQGYLVVVTDVTSEETARLQHDQLMRADRMISLGVLVSGVAHEINNPNQFIISHTGAVLEIWRQLTPVLDAYFETQGDFLLGGKPYSVRRNDMPRILGNIIEGSKRIKTIVQELRDYARESVQEEPEPVAVNAAVESALALSSALLKRSTQKLSVCLGEELPPVLGWGQRLEQVVINLLQNACQALQDQEAAVRVSTGYDAHREKVWICVADEGMGISEEHLPHVTDPFFTTKREQGGTGLGLSISSRIVADHGGELSLEPNESGGVTAWVHLPICRHNAKNKQRKAEQS